MRFNIVWLIDTVTVEMLIVFFFRYFLQLCNIRSAKLSHNAVFALQDAQNGNAYVMLFTCDYLFTYEYATWQKCRRTMMQDSTSRPCEIGNKLLRGTENWTWGARRAFGEVNLFSCRVQILRKAAHLIFNILLWVSHPDPKDNLLICFGRTKLSLSCLTSQLLVGFSYSAGPVLPANTSSGRVRK